MARRDITDLQAERERRKNAAEKLAADLKKAAVANPDMTWTDFASRFRLTISSVKHLFAKHGIRRRGASRLAAGWMVIDTKKKTGASK